jgi:hypothetical protein
MNARDSIYSHFFVSNTDSVVPRKSRGGEERVAQRAAHAEERCADVVHRGRVLARMLIIVDVDLVLLFVIVDVEEKDKLYVY